MFQKIPASKNSLDQRKLIYGVGINDADYITRIKVDGKKVTCPAYQKWLSMFVRCYSAKHHERQPTYKGCKVCPEWLTFSKFASWYDVNNVDGWHLDKDIKSVGNKVYSAENCLFVPPCINAFLNDHAAKRGEYPQGVNFINESGRFRARITIDGKVNQIGCYDTPELARVAYVVAKNEEIKRKCEEFPQFAKYLIKHLLS